jgi:hypothetical protein
MYESELSYIHRVAASTQTIENVGMTTKKVAKMVAEMLRRNELRLSRGYSGRYYLYYFDETKTEPFRTVILLMNNV